MNDRGPTLLQRHVELIMAAVIANVMTLKMDRGAAARRATYCIKMIKHALVSTIPSPINTDKARRCL